MAKAGPWYFAWVDQGTAFDPAVHNRMDEYIGSLKRILREGDKPRLELVIRNPHIGLLNSSRKQWAWLSRDSESTAGIVPIFYGRLIAAPKDLFKEMMTIDLIAWPLDYNDQRQRLVEGIKATGPYDPVFLDVTKRDDPDAVLEAVSGFYCVDPVTNEVTISDVINGEDGNVDISADQHLYDEMNVDFDQMRSLTAILMDANVTWNQTGQGFIDMGARTIQSYAGDAVIAEWPKPLSQLGGGYTVAYANAVDAAGVNAIVTANAAFNWTNKEKEHSDGDQLTLNWSISAPVGSAGETTFLKQLLTHEGQSGFLDPFGVDADGDPSPTNIPPHDNSTFTYVPLWTVRTSLGLQYRDLDRQRTERIQMLLQSDLQPIIVNPEVEQNSETITKTGTDVGIPIVNLLAWTTIKGQAVAQDTIVFADHPSLPGLRSAQIATNSGTAGLVTPNFSDIPGVTTADNDIIWASLGTPAPTETAFDWTALTNVGLGTIILPRKVLFLTWQQITQAGRQQFPPVGTQISLGTIIRDGAGNYQVCVLPGLSLTTEPSFGATRGNVTNDGSAQWKCIGSTLPDGKTHFLAVQAGRTGDQFLIPEFATTLHAQTTDGTVIWAAIGPGDIPVGGTAGDIWAPSYFTTARGNDSLEYLISIMRARARFKARAVTIDFTPIDPFGLGLQMTLRKTVTLHDTRLGGGVAVGKVIYLEHGCDGRTGRETCRVQIGCAIGKDNTISTAAGSPTYCNGYVTGYRAFTETIKVVGDESDVGYTPPIYLPNDDGLVFPLSKGQIVISEAVLGNLTDQATAVRSALNAMAEAAKLSAMPSAVTLDASAAIQEKIRALSGNSIAVQTALNPIWYDAVLKPASGHQFNSFYKVALTNMTCPRGIDLEAASTP